MNNRQFQLTAAELHQHTVRSNDLEVKVQQPELHSDTVRLRQMDFSSHSSCKCAENLRGW